MEFIPVVGPALGAVVILGVAFLANYHHLIVVAVFLGIWRLLQDYVTSPRIMGRKLQLHPAGRHFRRARGRRNRRSPRSVSLHSNRSGPANRVEAEAPGICGWTAQYQGGVDFLGRR